MTARALGAALLVLTSGGCTVVPSGEADVTGSPNGSSSSETTDGGRMGVADYSLMSALPSDTAIAATMTHIATAQAVSIEFLIGSDRVLHMGATFP